MFLVQSYLSAPVGHPLSEPLVFVTEPIYPGVLAHVAAARSNWVAYPHLLASAVVRHCVLTLVVGGKSVHGIAPLSTW